MGYRLTKLVPAKGIEPLLRVCKTPVLPLHQAGILKGRRMHSFSRLDFGPAKLC